MNPTDKIYVSGHNGMVGRAMLDLLRREGFNNIIVRNSSELDLRDQKAVQQFFVKEKPDYVFHFAAKVGGIMANIKNPAEFLYDNLAISTNVIESAYKTGVKKLLNLGSSCIYPRECPQPMKEDYLFTGPLEPTNEGYALSKIVALKLCEKFNEQYLTNFISLMPCNLYGPYDHFDPIRSHVIPALLMKFHQATQANENEIVLWGTGEARREFLYVSDLAGAAFYFMKNYSVRELNNQFVNIGSGEDISIKELALLISDIVGFKGRVSWDKSKPDGMPRRLLNVAKMKHMGFVPRTELQEGIRETYQYYLNIQNQ